MLWRYATGWLLVLIGLVNLVLGMTQWKVCARNRAPALAHVDDVRTGQHGPRLVSARARV
jgi:hypothetical protein